MTKTYAIVDADQKLVARFWWDGETIQSDNPGMLRALKERNCGELTFDDGLPFFEAIPRMYNNGYLNTRTWPLKPNPVELVTDE